MTSPLDAEGGPHRPDYPPKTPPPPKKPVEAPRPETGVTPPGALLGGLPGPGTAVAARPRLRARIANRRAANWTLDAQPWASKSAGPKAARQVLGKLGDWGYRLPADTPVGTLTTTLVQAALADGGTRISVHLADQDHQALILVLSHQPGQACPDDGLLHQLAAHAVVSSCGTDTDREDGGRRRWALIDL